MTVEDRSQLFNVIVGLLGDGVGQSENARIPEDRFDLAERRGAYLICFCQGSTESEGAAAQCSGSDNSLIWPLWVPPTG